jgi:hypothetical protein
MKFHQLAVSLTLTAAIVMGTQLTTSAANRYDYIAQQIGLQKTQPTKFKVRIENISAWNGQTGSDGTQWTLDFSPGIWLVHNNTAPLFKAGKQDRNQGLEAIAEDGDPTQLAMSLKNRQSALESGVFNTPVGAQKAAGIRPEQVFEFTVTATPGSKLSFATMFGQSNDWFYAPEEGGIALFDRQNKPIRGDVTAQIQLWDAGTEVDQEPGIGTEQGPRQAAKNTGKAENGNVHVVGNQFTYPATNQVMRVTITPE